MTPDATAQLCVFLAIVVTLVMAVIGL